MKPTLQRYTSKKSEEKQKKSTVQETYECG
jgi:hypothetical protein